MSMEHDLIPVAAVSATAAVTTTQKRSVCPVTATTAAGTAHAVALDKPPRRVLPEHEGRYKITLPSGTTKRSQEILAKKAKRKWECYHHQ